MGKKFFIIIFLFSLFHSQVEAQQWKKYRYEFSYGLGLTNFMGDIGAPAQNFITQYFWFNPYFVRPLGNIGFGYAFHERIHAKGNMHFGWISADDRYGEWRTRNLKFTSLLAEISVQGEIYIVKEKRKANIYRYESRFKRKLGNVSIPTYLFVGFGTTVVNTNLESIGAQKPEDAYGGEVIFGKKTTFAGTIPVGIGFRYKLTNQIYMGLEASLRYTLSDKIDNHVPDESEWIDSYQFLVLSLNYKMKSTRSGLPRFKMTY